MAEHVGTAGDGAMVRGRRFIGAAWQRARRYVRWPARSNATQLDPSARMFAGIRWRMTWWYSAVLAAILVVAGVLLYVGMRAELLTPVTQLLQQEAQQQAEMWQEHGLPPQCSPGPFDHGPSPYFVACYDPSGALIGADQVSQVYAPAFLTPTLAQTLRAQPGAPLTDSVDGGATFERIERYALTVQDPASHQTLGVIQVGYPIKGEVDALSTLLKLLVGVGLLTLIGCGIGGAILAARTLAPARLALERQQTFIADASHEIRTPLTLLRADAEVLLRGRDRLAPDDAPLLDDIVGEADHLTVLTDRLLTLARLDHGAYHMEQDIVDLGEVMASVVHRTRMLAAEREVGVKIEHAGSALVIGDPAWLGEVALILLDNAIKYNHPGGSVTLDVSTEGAHAMLRIRDTGAGIPPEHLAHVGERFFRVDKARSRQMGGAGLGLAIARGIAVAHKGTLTLESTPGQGTTATLRLPLATNAAPLAAPDD